MEMMKPSLFTTLCLVAIIGSICLQIVLLRHTLHSNTLIVKAKHEPTSFSPLGAPRLIWLMTFPNSGTSFTISMFRAYANETTASNYGDEHMRGLGFSVPVHHSKDYINGPFLSESKKRRMGKFILTKTHCGGYCSHCKPDRYVLTQESFQEECLTARRGFTHPDGTLEILKHQYDPKLVKKSIHMFRDPFDNIVSRFHLAQKRIKEGRDESLADSYPNDESGFKRWCKEIDEKYDFEVIEILGKDTMKILKEASVPCYSEFYRYIQWHNLAFGVVKNLNIPSLTLYYENYGIDFEGMKSQIMDFMESKEIGKKGRRKVAFRLGKSYKDFFSEEHQNAVEKFMSLTSSKETSLALRRYFDSFAVTT